MVDRPKHVDRAFGTLERTAETFNSALLLGDVQVVRGYVARLERRIADSERPTLLGRIRSAIARGLGR